MNNQFLKITLMVFILCGVALADIKDFIGVEIGKTTPNNLKKNYMVLCKVIKINMDMIHIV